MSMVICLGNYTLVGYRYISRTIRHSVSSGSKVVISSATKGIFGVYTLCDNFYIAFLNFGAKAVAVGKAKWKPLKLHPFFCEYKKYCTPGHISAPLKIRGMLEQCFPSLSPFN